MDIKGENGESLSKKKKKTVEGQYKGGGCDEC